MAYPEDDAQQDNADNDTSQAMAYAEATAKETIGPWPDEN